MLFKQSQHHFTFVIKKKKLKKTRERIIIICSLLHCSLCMLNICQWTARSTNTIVAVDVKFLAAAVAEALVETTAAQRH